MQLKPLDGNYPRSQTAAEVLLTAKAIKGGAPTNGILARYKISRHVLSKICTLYQIPLPTDFSKAKPVQTDSATEETIIEKLQAGVDPAEIAHQLEIPPSVVKPLFTKYVGSERTRLSHAAILGCDSWEEVTEIVQHFDTIYELQLAYGLSYATARSIWVRSGRKVPKAGRKPAAETQQFHELWEKGLPRICLMRKLDLSSTRSHQLLGNRVESGNFNDSQVKDVFYGLITEKESWERVASYYEPATFRAIMKRLAESPLPNEILRDTVAAGGGVEGYRAAGIDPFSEACVMLGYGRRLRS